MHEQDDFLIGEINKGFFWLLFSGLFASGIIFFLNIFIVRLVEPDIFGIMALCMTIITFLTIISSLGLGDAVINRKDNLKRAASAAFSSFVMISTLVSAAIILLSPVISGFFNEPRLAVALVIIMVGFWTRSISNIPAALLAREFRFKKISLIELASNTTNPLIVIASIFVLPKELLYISLPLGYALSSVFYSIAILKFSPRIKWAIDVNESRKLLSFGYKVAAAGFLSVLLVYGMNLFVGKFFGIVELGFFSIAFTITNLPIEFVSNSFYRSSYSGFSKIKRNRKKVQEIFWLLSEKTILIVFPVLSWLFVFADQFNDFILKKDPLLSNLIIAFCLFAFFRALQKNYTSVFAGIGKPGINLKITAAETAILLVLTAILVKIFGFAGVVFAIVAARLLSFFMTWIISGSIVMGIRKSGRLVLLRTIALCPIPVAFAALNMIMAKTMTVFFGMSLLFLGLFFIQYSAAGYVKKILR